ncbi:hypothetical protein [Chamaesiphon polymorphus]|uniref:hypothetical protein n=1 Tax=Chamaesiphon polymorphus TaxID=2107691 RepID=UPI0015E79742|nr:hypothetical protein [Chamaesiphon polymorphus]
MTLSLAMLFRILIERTEIECDRDRIGKLDIKLSIEYQIARTWHLLEPIDSIETKNKGE